MWRSAAAAASSGLLPLWRAPTGRARTSPTSVLGVRLLVVAVALRRLAEELGKRRVVRDRRARRLPLAAGEACRDLLQQPAVPVRILERGEREVGTPFGVAPGDAWVLDAVVEGAGGVVEDLAHVDAASDEVVAGGVEVLHGEEQGVRRAGRPRGDSLAEDDRGL
jgi:hypothetical protein